MNKQQISRILFEIDPFGTTCHWYGYSMLDEYVAEATDILDCMLQNRCGLVEAINTVLKTWDEDFMQLSPEQEDIINDFI
jgi:hypothetical protein